jgi:RHH-type rel operon transcriptional repressor/antitoxin RelB
MLALRLPEVIERRLTALAKRTGRSKSFYAREAILEYLDDLEAAYISDEVLKRIESGQERTYTIDELERELGLAD